MTRTDRRTLVRQLAEQGLSQRQIAARLKVSKDTVRRDLRHVAQAGDAGQEQDAPSDAPPGEPDSAPDAPARPLPQRTAQPLDGIDLSRWPAVRRDLAVLAQTGLSAEVVAFRAITALAHHYSRALAAGDIEVGQPFVIREMTLHPVPVAGRTAQAGS